jgi:hypothetical protein
MSSTTNESAAAPSRTTRVLTNLFAASVLFFLLAGLAIVICQAVALASGDATAARGWASTLAPYAFGGASVAGVLAFLLSYGAAGKHDDHIDDDSDAEVEDGYEYYAAHHPAQDTGHARDGKTEDVRDGKDGGHGTKVEGGRA